MTQELAVRPNGMDVAPRQEVSISAETTEKALLGGDLSGLNAQQSLELLQAICKSLGLNPLTRPFEYLDLDGKRILYARKDCAEQLRATRNISLRIVEKGVEEGIYVARAMATTPGGRTDESIGAVPIVKEGGEWKTSQGGKRFFESNGTYKPLSPDARANAIMKAETKAKRRVTLSICGLGMLDESELDTLSQARPVETLEEARDRRIAEETAKAARLTPPVATVTAAPNSGNPSTGSGGSTPRTSGKPTPAEMVDPKLHAVWDRMKDAKSCNEALGDLCEQMIQLIGEDEAARQFSRISKPYGEWTKLPLQKAKQLARDLFMFNKQQEPPPAPPEEGQLFDTSKGAENAD